MLVPLEPTPQLDTGAKRFVLSVAFICALLLATVAPAGLVFHNTGEALDLDDLAARQITTGGLYRPFFEVDEYTYKLALYRQQKPDMAVIGSSLPVPLGSDMVSDRLVNLGRAMPTIAVGPTLLQEMLASHRPRTMLIVLDFWWFNGAFENESRRAPRPDRLPHWSFRRAVSPYLWLARGTLTPARFGQLLTMDPRAVGAKGFGLEAILTRTGYARDGSRVAPRPNRPIYYDFEETLGRIKDGRNRFEYGASVDEARWRTLVALRRTAEEAGVQTVVVLPPLARRLQDAMAKTGRYGYVAELRRRVASMPMAFDFFDPESLGSSDCEFHSDGFHLSLVGWARISLLLRERLPDPLGLQFGAPGAETAVRAYEVAAKSPDTGSGACGTNRIDGTESPGDDPP